MLAKPAKDRFFEDYSVGEVYEFGPIALDEAAIVEFGRQYDPQYLHVGSPGVDELRWLEPVRPGDVLRIRVSVLSARVSRSKPDRGIVETRVETLNQRDEVVATMRAVNFIRRR